MRKIFKRKYPYLLLPAVLSLLLSLNSFWSRPLVPGFDAPFYLTEIRNFSQNLPNPLTYQYMDRYLTIAFPGLLSKIFGIDPVLSYRIAITAVYIGIAVSLYCLFINLTKKNSLAMVLSSAIIISPFLINYTLLYANFTAIFIFFSFFALETGRSFKHKDIVLGIVMGILFYTHNFSTISFALIIALHFLFKIISEKSVATLKDAAVIFVIAGMVGFIMIARYLNIDISFGHFPLLKVTSEPFIIGNEKEILYKSITLYMGKFWLYYFITFTVIVLAFFRKALLENKKTFIISSSIFIPSLILALQPFYNHNFLPDRFMSLVCLSTYFVYVAVITLPKFKKFIVFLAIAPLLLNYLSSDTLILNKGYRSFTEKEITIYQEIKPLTNRENSILLIPSDHYYWARYFLEGYSMMSGEHFVSCGNVKERGWINETDFTLAKLLAEKDIDTAKSQISQLKYLTPDKKIYILTDTSLSCGHGKILNSLSEAKQLYNQAFWYLYEIL